MTRSDRLRGKEEVRMSFWKRTMDYLGLGPDDAYDDYDVDDDYEPAPRGRRQPEPDARSGEGSCETKQGQKESYARCRVDRHSRPGTSIRRRPDATRIATIPACNHVLSERCGRGSGRTDHRPSAPLRPGPGGRRQVQGGPAGDHEPGGFRPRGRATTDRLRQRPLLRPRRVDGEGRQRRVSAQARTASDVAAHDEYED